MMMAHEYRGPHPLHDRLESLEAALSVATGYILALASDEQWEQFQDDIKKWDISVTPVKDIAAQYQCCTGNCNQGRNCPNRGTK